MERDQTLALAAVPHSARFAVAVLFFLTGVTFASWAVRIPAVQTRLGLSPGELGVAFRLSHLFHRENKWIDAGADAAPILAHQRLLPKE